MHEILLARLRRIQGNFHRLNNTINNTILLCNRITKSMASSLLFLLWLISVTFVFTKNRITEFL